jgi:hypothetical protein
VCRSLCHNFYFWPFRFTAIPQISSCLWQLDSVLWFFCHQFNCRCPQINQISCHFAHISAFIPV